MRLQWKLAPVLSTHPDPSSEAVLDPELEIIDPHHHLLVHTGHRYLIEEFQADLASGHNVVATIFAECNAMYRRTGPQHTRSVGEAEFVAGIAAMSDSGHFGPTRICAGFIGAADFMLGERIDEVLSALDTASGGRLRGIRGAANWDADASVNTGSRPFAPEGLLLNAKFRSGVSRLANFKLVYDAWQYHPQLPELCNLADALPHLPIVVNHCAGLVAFGPYAGRETLSRWKQLIAETARRPNTFMKLGGLARRCNVDFAKWPKPPTAMELAVIWRPYIEACIESFGPDRCMFESNFPPDRDAASYRTIWNAFKLIASGCSLSEKQKLFSGTARRVYRVE